MESHDVLTNPGVHFTVQLKVELVLCKYYHSYNYEAKAKYTN